MSEINLEFVDRTEENNEDKNIRKFIEDWASLVYDSSTYYDYYDKIRDSSAHYFEPLDDVVILDSSQISFTFKYDYDLIEK